MTAAQALANNIDALTFDIEIRDNGINYTKHSEVRKIWFENGLIMAAVYWSRYGWLKQALRPTEIVYILGKQKTPKEAVNALNPPSKISMQPQPKTTSHIFSQNLTPYVMPNRGKSLIETEVITAMVVYESLLEQVFSKKLTKFRKAVQSFLDDNGIMILRDYCIPLAKIMDEAYEIADAGNEHRCSNIAWDFEFVPDFLRIILDQDLQVKSNWKQIANAYGAYLCPSHTSEKRREAKLYKPHPGR